MADPETDWGACPHGFKRGVNRIMPGVYSAPIGRCRCCGTEFTYVGSGSYTATETKVTEPDSTLCSQCGGEPRRLHVKDGVTLLSELGTAPARS